MKLMFVDIETTGFGRKYDQIIELAAIIYDDVTGEVGEIFHQYARPKKPIPWKITELTGITDEMVEDADTEKDLMREFSEFVHIQMPDALVGHKGDSFDFPWIREKMAKYFLPWFNTPTAEAKKPTDLAHHNEVVGMFRSSHTLPTIDTLKIAKKEGALEVLLINGARENPEFVTKTGRASYKQENIAKALGFVYDAHSAIEDAKTLIKIYKHLFKTKSQKRKDAGF
jgi:DNA polymerase III epsilon subunit-like protein